MGDVIGNTSVNNFNTSGETKLATTGDDTTIGGSLDVSGDTTISSITESTNHNSGALVVKGGLGIGEDIYVKQDVDVGNNLNITENVNINGQEQSTNTSSGALKVSGGVGIVK